MNPLDKKSLSERDICTKFITPALVGPDGTKWNVMTQLREEIYFTKGRVIVRGKTVTVKLNLTGGPRWRLGGLPAHRTYHVHPHFVAATCAALHKAGAAKIILVESGYDRRPLDEVMAAADWDMPMIAAELIHSIAAGLSRSRRRVISATGIKVLRASSNQKFAVSQLA